MNALYTIDNQDQRDGGKHVVILSVIDERTGARMRETIATFEPSCKAAADAYVAWMNGMVQGEATSQ
jgi:hypothetical protein